MRGLWAGLVLAGVSPFICNALVAVRLNVLFFFFSFNLSFTGFNFAGGESSRLLSDSRIERSSQTKREEVCGPSMVGKRRSSGSGYILEIARSPLVLFQAMISNLRYQKSVKKVKKCKKIKVKATFLVGGQTGEDCLTWPTVSTESRSSLIDHEPWFGGFLRLSLVISPALSFFQKMLS